ncbi:DUF1254 domain-containing protein [Streptomyces sp. NPDC045470]|uniref:DUF1254 domain-containing protein n=1 Tax=Streptomyces sp. NPDC045470 TaxID=3155469 RepID=UPI0033F80363
MGSSSQQSSGTRVEDARSEEQWAYSVGIQNYVFGLPLTIFERERALRLNPIALKRAQAYAPAAPINQIGHMKTLATADDDMPYTPNNDTVYSGALLELREEPIILTAPDIMDRYWSVEVADTYTNNVLYIGTRATGGHGGHHAFVGPNWKGKLPTGVIEHRMPNDSVMFAIRIGVKPDDADDLAKVNAQQEQFTTTALSYWSDPATHGQVTVPDLGTRPHYDGDLAFFQTVADLASENPPAPGNEGAIEVLRRGGITLGEPMDADALSEPTRKGLAQAAIDGPNVMNWKVKYRGTPYPTRWNNLQPGTYGVNYLDRAAGSLEGLFVHDREEAEYFSTYEDGDAKLLDGSQKYVLHFDADQIPPTLHNGFWSITMYGADFQLVDNPINRYSIGDRTKDLAWNPDGSLDIYIQNERPAAPGHASNWLPSTQSGQFRLNYRVYLPTDDAKVPALLGKYLPPIEKTS